MSLPERLPPANVESERGVLGSILLDARILHEIRPILRAEDFYGDDHRTIYRQVCDVADRSVPVDFLTVAEALKRAGKFDAIGGDDALVAIAESVPHAVNGRYYAEIVRQKAISRSLIEAANRVLDDNYSNRFDADSLMERAERAVLGVGLAREREELLALEEADEQFGEHLDRRRSGREPGLRTGLRELDEMIDLIPAAQMTVVAARPSIGKSALLLGLARSIAEQSRASGRSVLFCTLEMSAVEVYGRLVSAASGVNGRLLNGYPAGLRPEDLAAVAEARREVRDLPIRIHQGVRQTAAGIASHARRLHHRGGCAAVVVDYLQLVAPDSRHLRSPRHEQVAGISHDLFALARELALPVLVGAQVNRASEQHGVGRKGDGRKADERKTDENLPPKPRPPRLADLRESGAIEQDANTVLLLHRPEHHDENDEPGVCYVNIAKNRGGRTGSVRLGYRKRLTQFHDLEEASFPALS